MRAALKRPWYLAAICLALTAIAIDWTSKGAAGSGMVVRAKAAGAKQEGIRPDIVESLHQQAYAAAHRAQALALISLVVAAAAAASFFFSIQTHESWSDVIPIGLGLIYVALLTIQV
ncbi:MAG TPA: hypothetical protein VHX68_07975 [Planctomycetaceae bacterium]|jgi:hypothetical protein|nr:hypothetical protein [Planctomycetaceae bacterium]